MRLSNALNNVAHLMLKQGKLEEAEPPLHEALEARREVHGPRHPDTLGSMINLAVLLMKQGKLAEAETMIREALEGFREVHGPRHKSTATRRKASQ